MELSNNPPRGTYDWFPEEFEIRKYIFDTWRKVCASFGYEEYLAPLVDYADIYRAKSGEDVGGKELTLFKDRAGRELAIRPEMTPSITRMISKKYNSMQKPIRYFSIANFFRNEKPQKGRNREFWQLNYDIFGDNNIGADIEVLQIAMEVMLAFNPPEGSFKIYINNRKLIDFILELKVPARGWSSSGRKSLPAPAGQKSQTQPKADEPLAQEAGRPLDEKAEIIRVLDKMDKLPKAEIEKRLLDIGVSEEDISVLYNIFSSENEELFIREFPEIENAQPYKETLEIMSFLESLGYGDYIVFKPSLMRGFDYYDGIVFEVFDTNKNNPRSLFGGGRYNGLANIFGVKEFPAVGAAPGDETIRLFLENWNLISSIRDKVKREVYYLPVLDQSLAGKTLELAKRLRIEGKNVVQELNQQNLTKVLSYGNKKGFTYVVIFGEFENTEGVYKVKNMKTGAEEVYKY